MNKSTVILLVCLTLAACGSSGGGSGDVASVSDVEEGSGPALDVSKTSSVETYVDTVVSSAGNTFDTADDDSSTQSSSSSSVKATGSSSAVAQKVCNGEKYSKDVNVKLTSSGGSATFTGLIEAEKDSNDLVASLNLDGVFSNYGLYGGLYLTGSAHKKSAVTLTEGVDYLCSQSEQSSGKFVLAGSLSDEYSGEFSISGKIGAAVTFSYTVSADISGESETETANITVNGTAEFKSNGKTVTCTIGRGNAPDTDIDSYLITCQGE